MAQQRSFGRPRDIDGKSGTWPATLVPLALLQDLKHKPIPITVSGGSNVIFTVNAAVTNPVHLWNGNDFIELRETLAHTMGDSATNTVIATTGALAAAQTPGAVGVKYYYVGQDTDGAISVHPSTNAPSSVEGPKGVGYLGHPGSARDRHWHYVGFSHMSATTPAFSYFKKIDNTYNFSNHVYSGVDTQPGYISMAVVPAHGVRVGGFATGAATETVELGGFSDFTLTNAVVGTWKQRLSAIAASAPGVPFANFDGITTDGSGNVLAHIDATATSVKITITRVDDVV